MKPVTIDPPAQDEIDEALATSAARSPALAAEFRRVIDAALADIGANPAIAAKVPRTRCRRFILRRFPYSVIYLESTDRVRVIAFMHHSRRPGYWKPRLRGP